MFRKFMCIICASALCLALNACTKKDDDSMLSNSETSSNSNSQSITLKIREAHNTVNPLVALYLKEAADYDVNNLTESANPKYISYNLNSTPLPLSWSYSDNLSPDKATLLISENEDISNADEFDVTGKTSTQIENLKTDCTYYLRLDAVFGDKTQSSEVKSVKTDAGVRMMNVDGVSNMRDIGGWSTLNGKALKQGLIYRSAKLDEVTESGKNYVNSYLKIKTDLDLRKDDEIPDEFKQSSPFGDGVNYIHIPTGTYCWVLGKPNFENAVKVLADINNYPIVFHCAAGADRTGTFAFIIKGMLGVDKLSLIMDYELTPARPFSFTTEGGGECFIKLLDFIEGYSGSSLQEKCYSFLSSVGVTDMEMSNIYNIMLTNSAVFDSSSLGEQTPINSSLKFKLIMRESKSVARVEVDGKAVDYSLNGDELTVNIGSSSNAAGIITFDDNEQLRFKF